MAKKDILIRDYDKVIRDAMARAMFVTAWANREEEKPGFKGFGRRDLMDVAPKTNREAIRAANRLAAQIVKDSNAQSLTDLYGRALNYGGKGSATEFGHYIAMEAMGHGVSWTDDNPEFPIKIPYMEFYLV